MITLNDLKIISDLKSTKEERRAAEAFLEDLFECNCHDCTVRYFTMLDVVAKIKYNQISQEQKLSFKVH